MLYFSLIATGLLLLLANGIAAYARHPIVATLCGGVALFVVPCSLMYPAAAIQAILLCCAAADWRSARRPASFLKLSCVATLAAHGLAGIIVLDIERGYDRLRDRYPFESMEGRLPTPGVAVGIGPLATAAEQRLIRLNDPSDGWDWMRSYHLKRLHEGAVELFVNNPGFGLQRMMHPNEAWLARGLRNEPVPAQPGPRDAPIEPPAEPSPAEEILGPLLDDSILDFVNLRGFGYLKDRRHVAGFQSHRFSRVPASGNRWRVRTLDLVSLLRHDPPAVYVSDHLPSMERLGETPTRSPDRFEALGLDALRRGEDILTAEGGRGVRMLGAIRSNGRCLDCHGGERGDLLGAFSYTLQAEGPGPTDPAGVAGPLGSDGPR